MIETTSSGNGAKKQLGVFAIVERKDTTKPPYWMRIGTAFTNRDGSINLLMDAFPLGPHRLQVREVRLEDRAPPRREAMPVEEEHP
jgi:hypothetical protein